MSDPLKITIYEMLQRNATVAEIRAATGASSSYVSACRIQLGMPLLKRGRKTIFETNPRCCVQVIILLRAGKRPGEIYQRINGATWPMLRACRKLLCKGRFRPGPDKDEAKEMLVRELLAMKLSQEKVADVIGVSRQRVAQIAARE